MSSTTLDFDDYIISKKENDLDFANEFDRGYEDFKIGIMLKEMRLETGMSQAELAEKLSTQKSVISRLENHSSEVSLSTLQKVAAVFGKQLRIGFCS